MHPYPEHVSRQEAKGNLLQTSVMSHAERGRVPFRSPGVLFDLSGTDSIDRNLFSYTGQGVARGDSSGLRCDLVENF